MDFMGGRQGFYSQQEQDDEIMNGPSSSLSHYTTGRSVQMADDRPQKFQWGWPAGRNSSTAELLHADQDRGEERWSELGATLSAGEAAQQQQQQHREHMFDKVVTPSDVGKLNRLVIPKQHAEKYFPLDPSTNDKGLLLNFEDRTGKPWRFRYSYWNSSQSYVMTKGWSRFVKEKRLDAGDIVSFHRGLGDLGKDRLYIDWRRRPDAPDPAAAAMGALSSFPHHQPYPFPHLGRSSTWGACSPSMGTPLFLGTSTGRLWDNNLTPTEQVNYNNNNYNHMYPPPDYFQHQHRNGSESGWYGHDVVGRPVVYQLPAGAAAPHPQQHRRHPRFGSEIGIDNGGVQVQLQEEGGNYGTAVGEDPGAAVVLESVPVLHGETAAAGKWLRLFGVNISSSSLSDQDDECEVLSSSTIHPPLHPTAEMTHHRLPLQLNFYDDGTTPVLQLNKGNPSASQSSLDLDV